MSLEAYRGACRACALISSNLVRTSKESQQQSVARSGKPRFVKLPGSSHAEVSQVACGDAHTLILDVGARVHACGQGRFGALGLGDGETRTQHTPQLLTALAAAPIKQLAAGGRHSAALTFGGAVLAWGWAKSGALGLPAGNAGVVPLARPLSSHGASRANGSQSLARAIADALA